MTALLLVVIIGMAALAIDVGHLMVVRNELRNAADAGALAGAGVLYTKNAAGKYVINTDANNVASSTTAANVSDASAVEVLTVERGHWCFHNCPPSGLDGVFTPNSSTVSGLDGLVGMSSADLDANTNYINAVRVVAGRGPAIPAASFFAGIFGYSGFTLNAESIAWLGFAGSNLTVDFPIAICRESILDAGGNFTCSHGRMINSSGSGYTTETGGWTNLDQPDTCGGAASANEVKNLINSGCGGPLSSFPLYSGSPLTTVGGQLQSAFAPLYSCWTSKAGLDSNGDGIPDRPWSMTLPVIECGGKNPGPCNTLVGAVHVEVLWIRNQNDPDFSDVPAHYRDPETSIEFTCPATCTPTADQPVCASLASEAGRRLCWAKFLTTYNIVDENGQPFSADAAAAGYLQKNIIFKPSCELASVGGAGADGPPSNALPERPNLVK